MKRSHKIVDRAMFHYSIVDYGLCLHLHISILAINHYCGDAFDKSHLKIERQTFLFKMVLSTYF